MDLQPQVSVAIVAAISAVITALISQTVQRRSHQATADKTSIEAMRQVITTLREELDRERAHRQMLEQRVMQLEHRIKELEANTAH